MAYVHPSLVVSPKGSVKNLRVVYDGGEWQENQDWSGWSIAEFEWDGDPAVGVRWNGGDGSIGTPQSRGIPTWFVLPRPVAKVVLDVLRERAEGAEARA